MTPEELAEKIKTVAAMRNQAAAELIGLRARTRDVLATLNRCEGAMSVLQEISEQTQKQRTG